MYCVVTGPYSNGCICCLVWSQGLDESTPEPTFEAGLWKNGSRIWLLLIQRKEGEAGVGSVVFGIREALRSGGREYKGTLSTDSVVLLWFCLSHITGGGSEASMLVQVLW